MFYISPTFLDSFRYYLETEDDEKSYRARRDLIDRLEGRSVTTEAMRRGIDFERDVCLCCDGEFSPRKDLRSALIAEMAEYVRGAIRQHHVSLGIMPGVTVHGYIDFLKGDTIYDVKTTKKYEFPKFLNHCQHLAYMAGLQENGIRKFKYLVTDFKAVYVEEYNWQDSMLGDLWSHVSEFLTYLNSDREMREAFERKSAWQSARRSRQGG